MKRIGFILFSLILMISLSSCVRHYSRLSYKNSPQTTSKRVAKYFDKIVMEACCNVHYIQGDAPGVRVVGPSKMVKRIVTECDGSTLTIRLSVSDEFFGFGDSNNVDVYVTSPDLIDVKLNGSGDFSADGKIDSDTLNVCIFGSGDVDLSDVLCDKMTTSLRGSGDIRVKRLQSTESSISLYGAGDINVNHYNVNKSDIVLRGVGNVDVGFADCGSVACELYGVGDISLSGSVKSLTKKVMGTGDIDTDELKIRTNK